MGPRLANQDPILATNANATSSANNSPSGAYQRRRQFSMPTTSSSSHRSDSESRIDAPNHHAEHRILLVSESQASLNDKENSSGGSVQQPTQTMIWEWDSRLVLFWAIHFICCLGVLVFGSSSNYSKRKYIPIDVSTVADQCQKGFVDVFSASMTDREAFVCCQSGPDMHNPMICHSPPPFLPFARRLARFPDAWLLPIFPLLVRRGWNLYCNAVGLSTRISKLDPLYCKRRLYFYLGLIQFRGWILYLAFDEIEDFFVRAAGKHCWYEEYLHPSSQDCQGQTSDFSDHVVLYFAQILPIALVEVLHSFSAPYWIEPPNRRVFSNGGKAIIVPVVLAIWLINLYVITFLGAYKTSTYFHTDKEVYLGYLVSLLVQIPLFLLQCSPSLSKQREYFFGKPNPSQI